MRFQRVEIRNFRAIKEFVADDLADLVVIAGPNGCGKSCILDAIRLLKSVYGGYQTNEWMQWFGEFQVNLGDPANLHNIFRDRTAPIVISARMQLAGAEAEYITSNAERLCEVLIWTEITRLPPETFSFSSLAYAAQFPDLIPVVAERVRAAAAQLREEAKAYVHDLILTLTADGQISTHPSLLAKVVFTTYAPEHIGIIDFHSASRTYAREAIGGVNLDVKAVESARKTQTLYNWQAKYQNVKTELVTMHIRSLIAKEGGASENLSKTLDDTLKELFKTFFPDKEDLGVQAGEDGTIRFPVRVSSGETHDINDLSSGEKEVLYGYLRLRSSSPDNSTILIDEPELHLNPGLLQGFPDFYYKHLAKAHGNQIWLVTHSDALLRQAVGNPNFSVFHMTMASSLADGSNQAIVVQEDELQAALLDLVGDLAAYRPTGKVIIFEGGGDTEFDTNVVRRLFPDLASSCNLVSGGSKGRVRDLYAALQKTADQTGIADRFYAITDRDSELTTEDRPESGHVLMWDVYHIENFFLDPVYVHQAYSAVVSSSALTDAADTLAALKRLAEQSIDRIVLVRLQDKVNALFRTSTSIGASPDSSKPSDDLMLSIGATFNRIDVLKATVGDIATMHSWETEIRGELEARIMDGSWVSEFPGRTILRSFVDEYLGGTASYVGFMNLVLNQMVSDEHRPARMLTTLRIVVPSL